MKFIGNYRIDEFVILGAQSSRFSSGAVFAPTGTPTYTIYENNTDNGPNGSAAAAANLAQRNSKTGLYTARVQLTAAAGYEEGKDYIVHYEETVDSVAAADVEFFRVIAAPTVDLNKILSTTLTETSAGYLAAAFKKLLDVATPVLTAASVNQTGDNYARIGAPAGASLAADVAAVKTDTAAVKTKTDFLPSATAGAAGGLFIAGTNAATVITTSLTTTFTGNLTGTVAKSPATLATADVSGNLPADLKAITAGVDLSATMKTSVTTAATAATPTVTAGTVSDKSGYSLAVAPPTAAQVRAEMDSNSTKLANLDAAVSTRSTYAGGDTSGTATLLTRIPGTVAAQTGDAYARLGTPAGASVSADIAAVKSDSAAIVAKLPSGSIGDATAASQAIIAGYIDTEVAAIKAKTDNLPASPAAAGDIPTAAAVADAVWDEAVADHLTSGTTGAGLNAAGSAGDPWGTALPGVYGAGSAGKIVGDNLNATVASRSSHSAADVWAVGTRTLTSFGTLVADAAAAVWAAVTRSLTDKAGFSLSVAPPTLVQIGASTVLAKQAKLDTLHDTRIPGVVQPQTGDAFGRLGGPAGANISADIAAVKVDTAAILDDTGTAGVVVASGSKAGYSLTTAPPTADEIVLEILSRKITFDPITGEFVVWNEAGDAEVQRLTPTRDAAAEPIIGMEPSA